MRVLFLTHRLPYAPNRGDRIRAFHLIRALAQHADVDLVSLVHDDEEASHRHDLDGIVSSTSLAPVSRVRNLARALPTLLGGAPLTHVLLHSPEVLAAVRRLGRSHRPDVVLAYCSGMAKYLFAAELSDVPAVLDMVDVDSAKWSDLAATSAPPRSWVFRREATRLRAFEARAAMRATATFVVNERERQTLATIAPTSRILTVPNGIDSESFRPSDQPQRDPIVVFCGVMNYAPNAQGARWMAEQVWPLVLAEQPGARLLIVGSNPTPEVRRLARLGVTVTGAVPDVRPYLWSAAVAVAPLAIARGLQNKVLEALAAGLPVAVTPAVAEGLPEDALRGCVVESDAVAFASAVVDLLRMSPQGRRAMAARANVTALDWASRLAPAISVLLECARAGR